MSYSGQAAKFGEVSLVTDSRFFNIKKRPRLFFIFRKDTHFLLCVTSKKRYYLSSHTCLLIIAFTLNVDVFEFGLLSIIIIIIIIISFIV